MMDHGLCGTPIEPLKYPFASSAAAGKYCIWICSYEFFHVTSDIPPTEREMQIAIEGFKAGFQAGIPHGRSQLQNEFRNLMGLK